MRRRTSSARTLCYTHTQRNTHMCTNTYTHNRCGRKWKIMRVLGLSPRPQEMKTKQKLRVELRIESSWKIKMKMKRKPSGVKRAERERKGEQASVPEKEAKENAATYRIIERIRTSCAKWAKYSAEYGVLQGCWSSQWAYGGVASYNLEATICKIW